jgi:hypothetical protein
MVEETPIMKIMPFALLALTLAAAPPGQNDPKANGTNLWRFVCRRRAIRSSIHHFAPQC